jgi:hypothetical protein
VDFGAIVLDNTVPNNFHATSVAEVQNIYAVVNGWWLDANLQTLCKHNQAPNTTITITKWMNHFKMIMSGTQEVDFGAIVLDNTVPNNFHATSVGEVQNIINFLTFGGGGGAHLDPPLLPVYASWIWGWWCRRVKCTKLLQNRVVTRNT